MNDTTVRQWIDRWQEHELLSPQAAQRLHDDVDTAAAAPPGDPRSGLDRALAAARRGMLEALGYLGTAVTLGAFVVISGLASWPEPALLSLTVLVAMVTGAGLFAVTPSASAAGRRLGGVLGLTSVAATAMALLQAFEPTCRQGCYWQDVGLPTVLSAVITGVAAVLYRRHRHLLTHAALAVPTAVLAAMLGVVLAGPSASTGTTDVWVGALLLGTSLAWVWACETGRLRPAWMGTLAAGALSYSAVFMITSPWVTWVFGTGETDHAVLAVLALAATYTGVGAVTSRLRATIVGAAGLAVSVPWALTDVAGLDATATASVLLPVGIALTVWAILASRREGSSGPPA